MRSALLVLLSSLLLPALLVYAASEPASVLDIQTVRDKRFVRVEIIVSRPVMPIVTTAQDPERLVLVLPGTLSDARQKRIPIGTAGVKGIRIGLHSVDPPETDVVVDMESSQPYSHALDVQGNTIVLAVMAESLSGARTAAPVDVSSVSAQTGIARRRSDPAKPPSRSPVPNVASASAAAVSVEKRSDASASKPDTVSADKRSDVVEFTELRDLALVRGPGGLTVELVLTGSVTPILAVVDSPARLVVDLPKTVAMTRHRRMAVGGKVKAVRVGMDGQVPPTTRVVVDLAQPLEYEMVSGNDNNWILRLRTVSPKLDIPSTPSDSGMDVRRSATNVPASSGVPARSMVSANNSGSIEPSPAPNVDPHTEADAPSSNASPHPPDARATPIASRPAVALVFGRVEHRSDVVSEGADLTLVERTSGASRMPLPGVTVSAVSLSTGQKVVTSTDLNGNYSLHVPADGRYVVRAEMAAFATATHEFVINTEDRAARVDLELVLLSRAQETNQHQQAQAAMVSSGMQNLALMQSGFSGQAEGSGFKSSDEGLAVGLQAPGMSQESATESVSISGNGNLSSEEIRQPGRFNSNRPHGTIYYSASNSDLDAAPYSLTATPQTKAAYMQNRFGGALGGPLTSGQKTFLFINYNGARSQNPFDSFSTVPTLDERIGNFQNVLTGAGQTIVLTDPCTRQPFANNTIPNTINPCTSEPYLNPVAQALLQYIPGPNLPGTVKNFRFTTAATNSSDDLNVRVLRAFGESTLATSRRGPGGRNNLNISFHYHSTGSGLTNAFPSVGGTSSVRSFDVPVGYVRSFGKLTNNLRFAFHRDRVFTRNLYAFATDIAGNAGVTGVSSDPFDWGIPNLSFTAFSGLNDTNSLLRRDQTFMVSDSMIWSHGKHTWRWGGDFQRIQINIETTTNPRGSFIFTGVNTGFDFADFLLGMPQLSSAQFGANNYHFRGNSWDLFAQDEYRVRANLSVNLGLRYEYISPFSEINDLIANLLVTNLGTPQLAVTRVLPSDAGMPSTLVRPDRYDFAPRAGIAWKPFAKTVVRAGYGVNYNTGAYGNIAQQLAFQPPFSFTQTTNECVSTASSSNCVPSSQLKLGFSATPPGAVTNNYAVDSNYRLGYVQIWNFDIQRELAKDLLLNLDYTGTKGTCLDVLEAPNRTATGPLNPNVYPFYFETALADSTAHAGTLRARKRLRNGVSIGGSYTYSKSIDNASTIGGSATVVAQDATNIAAERGLSSFDQRHRFTADYLLELPFGHDKRWLYRGNALRAIFGDWQWSGSWTIASGSPFTPRILGSFTDVNGGYSGTLRANLVPGQPIAIPTPSIAEWFNTSAFVAPPAGLFGNAGRNIIEGPGSIVFDMAVTKVIPLGDVRTLELRMQATNIFNMPQFTAIDTTVNSPTFGQVTTVGSMRRIRTQARFRF